MSPRLSGDNLFKILAALLAASAAVILIVTGYELFVGSFSVLQRFGLYFFTGTKWNPVQTKVNREIYDMPPVSCTGNNLCRFSPKSPNKQDGMPEESRMFMSRRAAEESCAL